MRKTALFFLILLGASVFAKAATRSDIVVLEATDQIQYRAQEAAQNYLLYYLYPHKESYRKRSKENIRLLGGEIKAVSTNTKKKKTKGILSYFATQEAEALTMLREEPSRESADTLLETSEIFAEGARSIARQHDYPFSDEEKMLSLTREMRVRLEEMVKYYTATKINPKDSSYAAKFKKAESRFMHGWKILQRYQYRDSKEKEEKRALQRAWGMMQHYLEKEKLFVPAALTLVTESMGQRLERLGAYHSRNQ